MLVGVGETIESLEDGNKITGVDVLLFKMSELVISVKNKQIKLIIYYKF